MAETYSTEFQAAYVDSPPTKTYRTFGPLRGIPFHYTQVLAGTAADTCVIARLPANSMIHVPSCTFYHEGFTSGMTLSVGHKAYTTNAGVVVALSATALINVADISNATGTLHGGMDAVPTPDDFPIVATAIALDLDNKTPVDIFVTFGSQVPGASAILNGVLVISNLA